MQVTPEELATLIGLKDIEIMVLQKQLAAAQKQIADLTPKPADKPLESVR